MSILSSFKTRGVLKVNIFVILLLTLISSIGFLIQYSAANADLNPWAMKQIQRFAVGLVFMFIVCLTDIRSWFSLAYILYGIVLIFLIAVETLGFVGMGAKRWIDLGFFNFQPSELMRVALVLALARYFHNIPFPEVKCIKTLIIPILMVAIPTLLVMRQPDLGTALLLMGSAITIFFASGVQLWKFFFVGGITLASCPLLWTFLHEYQKKRILIFLNPEMDPLGAGYHVMQSKIALGSGGLMGKGFLNGTQSHLNFLPEKQTDFIFATFGEEFGFIGTSFLIFLYVLLLAYNMSVAFKGHSVFGRYVATGLSTTLFIYMFVNIGMVCGIIPVVGVPLPFVSYGGTALMTLLLSQGLIFSVRFHNMKKFYSPLGLS